MATEKYDITVLSQLSEQNKHNQWFFKLDPPYSTSAQH